MANGRSAKEQLGVELEEPERQEFQVAEPEPEPERPEWLPEKFKDPEAFADSYRNLENELRLRDEQHRRELDDMREMLTGMAASQQQQFQPQPGLDQQGVNEQLYAAYENDPIGTMLFLANTAAQTQLQQYMQGQQPQTQAQQQLQGELIADNASRLLESKYPDWREYESTIGAMIEQNPSLLPPEVLNSLDATAGTLESIYKMAKYDDLASQLDEAQANGQDTTQMKRQAQSLTGNAGRPPEPSLTDLKMEQLLAAARGSSYSSWRGGA